MLKETSAAWDFVGAAQFVASVEDGDNILRNLIQRMVRLLLEKVNSERPAVVEFTYNLAPAFLDEHNVVRLYFKIDDWKMIPLIDASHGLRFERVSLTDIDGRVSHGIWGLYDNKPIVAMTARRDAEALYVRVGGGLRPAIVLRDGPECDA